MRIAQRFAVALGSLVLAMLLLGLVALQGLADLADSGEGLSSAVEEAILDGEARADLLLFRGKLQVYVLAEDPGLRREVRTELDETVVQVESDLAQMRSRYAQRPEDLRLTLAQERPYRVLLGMLRRGQLDVPADRDTPGARSALARKVREVSLPMVQAGDELAARNVGLAQQAQQRADEGYRSTRRLLLVALLLLVAVGAAAALWLVRTVLPRTRLYSAFAREVAAGSLDSRVPVEGKDELADLGEALNSLVAEREVERLYAQQQGEFVAALQVAGDEREAHELLKRHLERTVPGGEVTLLSKNNSADRLEPRTDLAEESPLALTLQSAGPRSCLAVRFARTYGTGGSRPDPLLSCDVCSALSGSVTCRPMLVSGEVIGSLILNSQQELTHVEEQHAADSTAQAAPVLGNLRNLALAESRAATDSLTGLPNKRAVRDTMKQMAAQAARAMTPLAVSMLDLDPFKQVNDSYGHAAGDDVLAAVGAALRATVRQSDFAGRIGGEEFILLLPGTGTEAALVALEKVRLAISGLSIAGIDQPVTASLGLAVIPDHAGDIDSAMRAADRGLYAAKAAGRNRIVVIDTELTSPPRP